MLIIGAEEVRALAPMPELIDALARAFVDHSTMPPRQVTPIPGGTGERLLLTMPAFETSGFGIIKLATVFPDNSDVSLPTIQGAILVFSDRGEAIAIIDGATVTQLRTGAASALASRYLSRTNSSHLLIVGTGALTPAMVAGHIAERPISRVSIWGRRTERITASLAQIRDWVGPEIELSPCNDLARGVSEADIVSCATSAATPLVLGEWLKPGTHIDLVGSFSPEKREADDCAVLRARIFVDTFEGALSEAGDLLQPMRDGLIARERIESELSSLISGKAEGRRNETEITLFKSVGAALEDLAAARVILGRVESKAMI